MRSRWLTYAFLVIVAIVVGVITAGLPSRSKDPALIAASPDTTTVPNAQATTIAPRTTTSTTTDAPAANKPSAVTVLVANGTEVDGAATRRGDELKARGYSVLSPVDAETSSAKTRVYFAINGEADARAIASVLGAPDNAVAPLPEPLPVLDLQSATVLVVVGNDLAGA